MDRATSKFQRKSLIRLDKEMVVRQTYYHLKSLNSMKVMLTTPLQKYIPKQMVANQEPSEIAEPQKKTQVIFYLHTLIYIYIFIHMLWI